MIATNLRAALLAAAASLTATTLTAQSLDGQVERNPDDTVTYTIDLAGPPRGTGFIFAGPLGPPLNFPGLFGNLYLDPLGIYSIFNFGPPLLIDPSGSARFQLQIPRAFSRNWGLGFQALVIDPRGALAMTQTWKFLLQDFHVDPNPQCTWSYDASVSNDRIVRVRATGNTGGEVRFRLTRPGVGIIAQGTGNVGITGNGQATDTATAEPRKGDQLEVFYRESPSAPWKTKTKTL